ncbi:MAG: HAD family hydrolase [Candidatus Zixiibacteriota bacterium]
MTREKIEIDGVIFDLGSTLLEYENSPWDEINAKCVDAGYEFLKEEGYRLPSKEQFYNLQMEIRQKYRERADQSLAEWSLIDALYELIEALHIKGSYGMTQSFYDVWYKPIADQITIFDDTQSTLKAIQESGKKIGLVSNTIFPREFHHADLARFDLHKYFDFQIYSSAFGWRKPDPKIYKKATAEMNLPANRILFVGDRFLEDIKGPRDFGMKAILKYRENREYPDPFPDDLTVVGSLSELLDNLI